MLGGQTYRIPPMTTAAWEEKKILFDEKTVRMWPKQSFVDDRFDLENPIQTKAEFSNANAVMDKIGRREEEDWVGSRFAASMWMYTKAVVCNGARGRAELQAPQIKIHYESCELGVRQCS